MFNPGPIFLIIGALLATLGVAMMIPALVDLANANTDWVVFAASSLVTTLVGLGLAQTGRGRPAILSSRQAVLMTVGAWTVLPAFAALPLLWSGATPTYTDAFFEAMSGITTTGATVVSGLDDQPPGVLIWRSMLQWLGGLGVVVMAVSILPMLRVGGMQLFKTEAFDTPDKILPRATQISGSLIGVFSVFTLLCTMAYTAAGMTFFDAVNHAMTTVATGGYSTRDASIGYFQSGAVELIGIIFMILGSLPFLLYVQALQGRPMGLLRDSQVHVFLVLLIIFSLIIALSLDPLTAERGVIADLRGCHLQRGLHHDRHRLCLRKLRPVGRDAGGGVSGAHAHRWMRWLDRLRHEDFPRAGGAENRDAACSASCLSARRVCDALQWTARGWLGCLRRDELHFSLLSAHRRAGHRAHGHGSGSDDRVFQAPQRPSPMLAQVWVM